METENPLWRPLTGAAERRRYADVTGNEGSEQAIYARINFNFQLEFKKKKFDDKIITGK